METFHTRASRPRILIADDHAIFAEALCVYLEKTFNVIGVVADGRAMLEESIRLRPDVIVADVSMPSPERTGCGSKNQGTNSECEVRVPDNARRPESCRRGT